VKIELLFKWYDIWVGLYVDRINKTFYLCLLPMIVLKIKLPRSHYLIYGKYYKEKPMGCCDDKEDALNEEPGITFVKIKKKNCSICNRG
jgi:hypothetical protein